LPESRRAVLVSDKLETWNSKLETLAPIEPFEKPVLQAGQKGSAARRAKNRRAQAYFSQYVGARRIERNEADEPFSPAC
jgi:hypothetical protein